MNTENGCKVNPDTEVNNVSRVLDQLHSLRRTSNIARIAESYEVVATRAMTLIDQQRADNAKLTREYNEIRDAYMEVSEKNAQQAKQLAALRIAVRELAGKDPAPTGTTEAAQEVPQPKDNPEKMFEERRGCGCGCDMHVSVLKEDEVPEEVKIMRMINSI